MSQDIVTALITIAKADTAVAALVGADVYGSEVPESIVNDMPKKALIIQHSGGPQPSYTQQTLPVESINYDFKCYAENTFDADEIRRAVHSMLKLLKHEITDNIVIYWCQPISGPTPFNDSQFDWPYMMQSWRVLADERVTA